MFRHNKYDAHLSVRAYALNVGILSSTDIIFQCVESPQTVVPNLCVKITPNYVPTRPYARQLQRQYLPGLMRLS
jgi:hypothetical protein